VASNTGQVIRQRNNKKPALPKLDSITGVNPTRSHGVGLWGNKRVVIGIRVDEGLYNAFKPVAKRVFGSVCSPFETFMATVLASNELGVNFGNTVEIGTVIIERNLRERRKLLVKRTKPTVTPKLGCDFCGKVPVVGSYRHTSGIQKRACGYHAEILKAHPNWKPVHSSNQRLT